MIRQYLELTYPTLADARVRGPVDVARTLASMKGYQLAGPLSFVERSFVERSDEDAVTCGVAGFEVTRPDGAPELWPGAFEPPPIPLVAPAHPTSPVIPEESR